MKKALLLFIIYGISANAIAQIKMLNDTIRVERSGGFSMGMLSNTPLYHIIFTNNNWKTKQEINIGKDSTLNYQNTSFSKKQALKIAESLKSYQACIDFNEKTLFHTRVEEQVISNETTYVIAFTDNNWRSKQYIKKAQFPDNGNLGFLNTFSTKSRSDAELLAGVTGYGQSLKACRDNNEMEEIVVTRRNGEIKRQRALHENQSVIIYRANKWGNIKVHKKWTTALDNPVLEKAVITQTDKTFKIVFGDQRAISYEIINSKNVSKYSVEYNVKSDNQSFAITVSTANAGGGIFLIICENEWVVDGVTEIVHISQN